MMAVAPAVRQRLANRLMHHWRWQVANLFTVSLFFMHSHVQILFFFKKKNQNTTERTKLHGRLHEL